jgi:hypothetical protein
MTPHQDSRTGWTRLEETLVRTKPGDAVALETLVAQTGLARDAIATVMDELKRVQLFDQQEGNVFVRRSLWEHGPERQRSG